MGLYNKYELTQIVTEMFYKEGYEACIDFINNLAHDGKKLTLPEILFYELKAYVSGLAKNYIKEIEYLTELINSTERNEVSSFFFRGWAEFKLQLFEDALRDFTDGLLLCEHLSDDNYKETLYFLRADTYFRLGKIDESIEDLKYVRDDFIVWTDKLRKKEELLNEISLIKE